MGLFGRKKSSEEYAPEPLPSISTQDLADASRLMDQWDTSLGNSDAVWGCIEAIARRGGFRGPEAALMEVADGKPAGEVTARPWRWWTEAARLASSSGSDVLAGRIFLFTHLFVSQFAPKMTVGDKVETGLESPPNDTYKQIGEFAVRSLSRLPDHMLIHDTATGQVDVASALQMAESISGVTRTSPTESDQDDAGPFNTL